MPTFPAPRRRLFVIGIMLTLIAGHAHGKSIFGWIERVKLAEAELAIDAKLDTGADTSSLNAPDPESFEKDDQDWVRFTVKNSTGDEHTFERPVERMVRIRSASGTGRRYVVKMEVCVGDVKRETEVNLADREDLSYQMLIGRSFMEDYVLVDSASKHTRDPVCNGDNGDNGD